MYFTYLLGWTKHKKYYYGVRYKNGITEDSLGTTYWSSSKYVHKFIEENGYPDIIQIRRRFNDKKQAKNWEDTVIRRVRSLDYTIWLNKSNNSSFKGIVMDDEIKTLISKSKIGKSLGILYNDGIKNKYFKSLDIIPDGWTIGRLQSEKQKAHIAKLNDGHRNKTPEEVIILGAKISNALKGKKKPKGFGAKISNALKGKKKPWQAGENNVSKRQDVKDKISKSNKGRTLNGSWYNNGIETLLVRPEEEPPEGFYLGKFISEEGRRSLSKNGKQKLGTKWYNNGVNSGQYKENTQPLGWVLGRLKC